MKRQINAAAWREADWFIAQCPEADVASQGETLEEALDNLREALALHFSQPVATRVPDLETVRRRWAQIPGSLAADIIAEREERF